MLRTRLGVLTGVVALLALQFTLAAHGSKDFRESLLRSAIRSAAHSTPSVSHKLPGHGHDPATCPLCQLVRQATTAPSHATVLVGAGFARIESTPAPRGVPTIRCRRCAPARAPPEDALPS